MRAADLAGMYGKGDDPELLASDDLSQAEVSSSPQSLDQVASSPRSANQLDISEGLGQLHEDDGANQLDSGDATGKTSTDSYAEDVLSDNNPRPSGQDDSSRHPSHSHEIQANPAADDVDPVNDASPINIGGLDTEEKRPPAPSWARAVEDSVAGRVLEAKVRKAEGLVTVLTVCLLRGLGRNFALCAWHVHLPYVALQEEIKAAESEIAIKDEVRHFDFVYGYALDSCHVFFFIPQTGTIWECRVSTDVTMPIQVIRLLTKKLGRLGHFSPSPTERSVIEDSAFVELLHWLTYK
jgi:hypothetical protein